MADRVIIFDVCRGPIELNAREIKQMSGRAGRKHGESEFSDVHIVLPMKRLNRWKEKMADQKSYEVNSQLSDPHSIAFHVVSRVVRKEIYDKDSFEKWYGKTFDYLQRCRRGLSLPTFEDMAVDLHKTGTCFYEPKDKTIKPRPLGRVCANFYFSPYDVHDWFINFCRLHEYGLLENDNAVEWAIANIRSAVGWESKDVKRAARDYLDILKSMRLPWKNGVTNQLWAVHCVLGRRKPRCELPLLYAVRADFPRVLQALRSIARCCVRLFGDIGHVLDTVQSRLDYGISGELTPLVKLPGIGKGSARELKDHFDIKNEKQMLEKIEFLRENGSSSLKHALTRYMKEQHGVETPNKKKRRKKMIGSDELEDS